MCHECFEVRDDGKCIERQMLRAGPPVRDAIWLDHFITILSGR
jgi:hypothetical protein